jgi:hypothetical protein
MDCTAYRLELVVLGLFVNSVKAVAGGNIEEEN